MKFLGNIVEGWQSIIYEIRIEQLPVRIVEHLLEERVTDPHHGCTLFLPNASFGVNRLSDIGYRDQSLDPYLAGLLINIQLHHPHSHFPKNRQLVVRNIRAGLAMTDQLAAGAFAKALLQRLLET